MDLKRIAHLVALADTRSYSRAARQVHLSQPAFSRSIQAAEAELGLDLFERGPKGIACTPAGQFVIERARRVLAENAALEREVTLYREGLMGDLSLGIGPHVARLVLAPLLTGMRTRHPYVNCDVQILPPGDIVRMVLDERIELGLATAMTAALESQLELVSLFRFHSALVCRAGHPLANRRKLLPEALDEFGIAMTNVAIDGPPHWSTVMDVDNHRPLPIRLVGPDVDTLIALALATDTALLISEEVVRRELDAGTLTTLDMRHPIRARPEVALISLRNRTRSPAALAAIQILHEVVDGMAVSDPTPAGKGAPARRNG